MHHFAASIDVERVEKAVVATPLAPRGPGTGVAIERCCDEIGARLTGERMSRARWERIIRLGSTAVLCAIGGLAPGPATGQSAQERSSTLVIPRVTSAPELAWFVDNGGGSGTAFDTPASVARGVEVTDFRQREPGDGTPASRETTAYLSYDDDNLYVIFVAREDSSRLRANVARREDIGSDDAVAIYLDTFHDRQRAYFFMVNPHGVQLDGIRTEGQDEDRSWDAVWESEGRLTEDGFVVRFSIPFRSLRFPQTDAQTWGIALARTMRWSGEEAFWPYITDRVSGFVPQFGTALGLHDISPGLNVQVNPYTTLARARVLEDDPTPAFRPLSEARLGVDGKFVLFDALALDATVNPDFSQVETDDPQVTVNERFEVYFPEKRPFFLENSGYFQSPINLFFSRRIIDPQVGLRVTGQRGRWAVGAIAMNDRAPAEIDAGDPLFGRKARVATVRVQRGFGEESNVGVLVADRGLGGSFNRTVSADSRVRLGDAWAFTGQLVRSETKELDGGRFGGFGALAKVDRDGRQFEYSGEYLFFDDDFDASLGFVRRVGIRQTEHEIEYQWFPEAKVVSFGPTLSAAYDWDTSGTLLDREIVLAFQVEIVGDTELEVEHTRYFERFEGMEFRPHATELALSSDWWSWLGLDASYAWGTAVNHDPADGLLPFRADAAEGEVGVTFRPTPALRADLTYLYGRLATEAGQRFATERLVRMRAQYQFNRFLSARAIVDYEEELADPSLFDDDERERQWDVDLLVTYLLRPGTALYVGYTDQIENVRLVSRPGPEIVTGHRAATSVGRQLFVKLSYLWRF